MLHEANHGNSVSVAADWFRNIYVIRFWAVRSEETLAGTFLSQVSFFLKRDTGRADIIVCIWQSSCNHVAAHLKTKSTWGNGRLQSYEISTSLMGHWATGWSSPGALCWSLIMWDNKCSSFKAVKSSFLLPAVKGQLSDILPWRVLTNHLMAVSW